MSEKQKEIFRLFAAGNTAREIAEKQNITIATVRTHVRAVLERRDYKNITHAIHELTKNQII